MGIYIHPKLSVGFEKLKEVELGDELLSLLTIVANHRLAPDKVKQLFLELGKTEPEFWRAINAAEKQGYLMWYDIADDYTGKKRTEKYEVHPDLKEYLRTKYPNNSRHPETVFSLQLSHINAYSFQVSFIMNESITLKKGQKFSAHLDIKWKRAILEIKRLT